jgi:hypothetical protein
MDDSKIAREREETVHLFRGAPCVRSWSKYQQTVEQWTLCGIQRKSPGKGHGKAGGCVAEASRVTCPYCLQLMAPSPRDAPAARRASK